MLPALLQREYFDNPVSAYVLAGLTFAAVLGAFLAVRRLVRGRANLAAELIEQVRAHELVVLAVDFAIRSLDLPHRFEHALHVVTVIVVSYRLIGLLSAVARFMIDRVVAADASDRVSSAAAHTATLAAKAGIWVAAVLFALSNLGYNVSSVLAGLGIGGVAVALAAQAVLGDLFAAVAIFLDKPFIVGDSIKVVDFFGTVEQIGLKTTRVRALSGELLIYPNSQLTTSRIQNFSRLEERRVAINFSVPLTTPTEVLKNLPKQVAAVVNKTPDVRFGRAHLSLYQDSGLQFEVVFHVLSADYAVFMDAQQSVLLGLLESLRADGLDLAQPTTVMIPGGKS